VREASKAAVGNGRVLSNTFTWCRASPSPNASNGLISERMISMAQALHGLLSACAGLAIRRKAYKLELSLLRKLTGARTILHQSLNCTPSLSSATAVLIRGGLFVR
jgi:hypothetical protein